ncbi:DUF3558 domain-containing protein [Micromonospora narathiwatensis]|uniref:DUF3558 domain-containing protein n=1 Tax=Micromonospora narathiwatensis TaxID=299146 RepID=A0A1A8ZQI4_9ACTN|nr:DUF3558 domain-containing protein [Micromonospora narathiwatensis]SBT46379.1 Protein of unknown function (DUF3558) [Micromonospora narathiwatensis]
MTGRTGVGRWLLVPSATVLLLTASACGRSAEPSQTAGADREPSVTSPAEPTGDGDSPAAPDKPEPEACDLVTDKEAAALARLKLDPKRAGQQGCTWTAPVTGPTGQVEVYVGDGAKKILDIERQLGHELETLSGVGDEAYLDTQANEVFVQKTGTWVAIRLVLLNDPKENHKPLKDLVRVVADRL